MRAEARRAPSQERAWMLRALLVLQSPRSVFAALRDDSEDVAHARQEPVTAIMLLAGIAGVLWTPVAGRLLDDPAIDGLLVAVWAFLGGAMYGLAGYWLAGGAFHLAARSAGSLGSYRRARHLVAFAAAPLALSLLVVWPLRLALFGGDSFRSGGSDSGAWADLTSSLQAAFLAWSLALLVVGTRTVHGWGWLRSLETVAIAALIPAALIVGLRLLGV